MGRKPGRHSAAAHTSRTTRKVAWMALVVVVALAQTAAAASQTIIYVHTDALGSIVAETNTNGSILEQYDYEPYGTSVGPQASDSPAFTGHVGDAATGLSYMQERYYDPHIAIFLSPDPVGSRADPAMQLNRYRYANSNPYSFVDPDGRQSTPYMEAYLRHYYRNGLNTPPRNREAAEKDRKNWRELSDAQSVFHKQGEGGKNNTKWVDRSGHNEAVYDGNGYLVTDLLNGGTYNYYSPDDFLGHTFYDIVPYLLWGNGPIVLPEQSTDGTGPTPSVTIGQLQNPDAPTPEPPPPLPENQLRTRY